MRPDLVPVGGDGRAGGDGRSGQLEGTGATVVIAGDVGVSGILDGVATAPTSDSDILSAGGMRGLLGGPGTLDGGLACGGVVRSPERSTFFQLSELRSTGETGARTSLRTTCRR